MGTRSDGRCVVACGHLCLDIIPAFPQAGDRSDWFRPGALYVVGAPVISTGGAVSNVGLSLNRLGVPVRLSAKIGRDPLGRLILERIDAEGRGLSAGILSLEGEISSYTAVINPPGVDRIFYHCPGANDTFAAEDVTGASLQDAAVFHFGYPPLMRRIYGDGGEALRDILRRARAAGALTSLDMSLPDPRSESGRVDWKSFLSRVLPFVDLFVPSIEESLFMLDRGEFDRFLSRGGGDAVVRGASLDDVSRVAGKALELGARAVLMKMGHRGAYLRTAARGIPGLSGWEGRELHAPVFCVERVAGTTGAGDATIAGFLASVYKGLAPEEALSMAVAVGGCCVEAPDATSGIRGWDATVERVRAGWKRSAVPAPEAGWTRTPGGVWTGPRDGKAS